MKGVSCKEVEGVHPLCRRCWRPGINQWKLSISTGELDDTQKQKIEDLKDRIRKQDDELFSQRKQLIDLSNLVEEQKSELIKRDGKLKEQMYVAHVQEERLQDKGKEIVHLLQHQEAEREEQEIAEYQTDKKVWSCLYEWGPAISGCSLATLF